MKSVLRVLTAVLMVVVPTAALAQTAAAAPVDINYDCRADTPLGDQFATLTVEVTAPATVGPGAAYELPTITAQLTAGQSGTIESKLYGTSYDDPGLDLTVVVGSIIGDVDAPTACFPNPNPVLSTTTIG